MKVPIRSINAALDDLYIFTNDVQQITVEIALLT